VPKARLSERRVPRLRLREATFIHLSLSVNWKQISTAFCQLQLTCQRCLRYCLRRRCSRKPARPGCAPA
jgi:hypothetical protein